MKTKDNSGAEITMLRVEINRHLARIWPRHPVTGKKLSTCPTCRHEVRNVGRYVDRLKKLAGIR